MQVILLSHTLRVRFLRRLALRTSSALNCCCRDRCGSTIDPVCSCVCICVCVRLAIARADFCCFGCFLSDCCLSAVRCCCRGSGSFPGTSTVGLLGSSSATPTFSLVLGRRWLVSGIDIFISQVLQSRKSSCIIVSGTWNLINESVVRLQSLERFCG